MSASRAARGFTTRSIDDDSGSSDDEGKTASRASSARFSVETLSISTREQVVRSTAAVSAYQTPVSRRTGGSSDASDLDSPSPSAVVSERSKSILTDVFASYASKSGGLSPGVRAMSEPFAKLGPHLQVDALRAAFQLPEFASARTRLRATVCGGGLDDELALSLVLGASFVAPAPGTDAAAFKLKLRPGSGLGSASLGKEGGRAAQWGPAVMRELLASYSSRRVGGAGPGDADAWVRDQLTAALAPGVGARADTPGFGVSPIGPKASPSAAAVGDSWAKSPPVAPQPAQHYTSSDSDTDLMRTVDKSLSVSLEAKSARRTSVGSMFSASTTQGDNYHKVTQLAARSEELLSLRAELTRTTTQLSVSRTHAEKLKILVSKLEVEHEERVLKLESHHADTVAVLTHERDSATNKLEAVRAQLRIVTAADAQKAGMIATLNAAVAGMEAQIAALHEKYCGLLATSRRLALKAIVANAYLRPVAAAFGLWRDKAERARRVQVATLFAEGKARASDRSLILSVLQQWQAGLASRRLRAGFLSRLAARQVVRRLRASFQLWCTFAANRTYLRAVATRAAARWSGSSINTAWRRWEKFTHMARLAAMKNSMRHSHVRAMVGRLVFRGLRTAFLAWRDRAVASRRVRGLLGRLIARWQNRGLAASVARWADYVAERTWLRGVLSRLTGRCKFAGLRSGFQQWRERTVWARLEEQRRRELLRAVLARSLLRKVNGAFEAWRTQAVLCLRVKQLKARLAVRRHHSALLHSFKHWDSQTADRVWLRGVLSRLVGRWRGASLALSFRFWLLWSENERRLALLEAYYNVRIQGMLTRSAMSVKGRVMAYWRKWAAARSALRVEYKRAHRFSRSRLLARWFYSWRSAVRHRVCIRETLTRLVVSNNRKRLNAAMHCWRTYAFIQGAREDFAAMHSQVLRAVVSQIVTPPAAHDAMVHAIASLKVPAGLSQAFRAWKSRTQHVRSVNAFVKDKDAYHRKRLLKRVYHNWKLVVNTDTKRRILQRVVVLWRRVDLIYSLRKWKDFLAQAQAAGYSPYIIRRPGVGGITVDMRDLTPEQLVSLRAAYERGLPEVKGAERVLGKAGESPAGKQRQDMEKDLAALNRFKARMTKSPRK